MTRDPDKPAPWVQAARLASLGLELAIAVAVGLAIGTWLDGKLGTEPWLTLVFLVLGFVAGLKGVIVTAQRAMREAEGPDDEHGEGKA